MDQTSASLNIFLDSIAEGFAGGLIGAFLKLTASYFTEVGVNVASFSWSRRLVFLLSGALTAAIFDYQYGIGLLYAAVVGSGWTDVIVSFKKALDTFRNGLRHHLSAAGKELIRSVLESIKDEEAHSSADA